MPLLRQGGYYLVFGVLQLLLDWLLLVALTALGMPVAPANLASRTSAALLGFFLLNEPADPPILLGMCLIFMSMAILSITRRSDRAKV